MKSFLQKIFTNKREEYLLKMIGELKQDKEQLLKQVNFLQNELINRSNPQNFHIHEPQKPQTTQNKDILTKKEREILDYIEANPKVTRSILSKTLNIKPNTLKVYLSNMKKKGFETSI
jgi:DNA-binding CsgD family transcriptional regulator